MILKQLLHYPPNSETMPRFDTSISATLVLVLLSWFLPDASAQSSIAECGPSLVQLAPCAPFVQGVAATPVHTCCESLSQLSSQNPGCVCLLLNDTSLASSFPINATLALQLPALCSLQMDPSSCGGTSGTTLAGVSLGEMPNSTVAASPMVTVTPRPSSMPFGIHHSAEVRLKLEVWLLMLQLATIFAVLARTH